MPGTRISIRRKILVAFALSLEVAAAQENAFPLNVGNQWVYRATGAGSSQPVVVEVTGAQEINGATYFLTAGFTPDTAYLRLSSDGGLFAYDPAAGTESPWIAFGVTEGSTFLTSIDSCSSSAILRSKSTKADLAIGSFSNLIRITYIPTCADAGITEELYLPYIGLVRRGRTTFAGPRTLDLVYARIGGVTVVGAPEVSFTLAVDQPFYVVSSLRPSPLPPILARLTLRNTGGPLTLNYADGQEFDLVLRNAKSEVVYRWSASLGFTQALRAEQFAGERNRAIAIPLTDSKGATLPPGNYTLEAFLTAQAPSAFRAQVGLSLR